MKLVSKDGRTWFQKNKEGKTEIGFTNDFLRDLDECWHIMAGASNRVSIKEAQPLCSVETNDGLFSVASPVSGVISFFNTKAMNFPDKITSEEVIAVVAEKAEEARDALTIAMENLRQMELLNEAPVRAERPLGRAERVNRQNVPEAVENRIFAAPQQAPAQPVRWNPEPLNFFDNRN